MGGSVFRRRYYAHVSLCKGYLKGRVDDKGFFSPGKIDFSVVMLLKM
nr:hypothetical protein [Klebsiella pneumoniae]QAR17040.1 hypothetical protein [Klebsiella pneumoniae]